MKPLSEQELREKYANWLVEWTGRPIGATELVSLILQDRKAYGEYVATRAFKDATYQNIDGDAKYWSESGDYNSMAMDKFFPQEWFDKKFLPALKKEVDNGNV